MLPPNTQASGEPASRPARGVSGGPRLRAVVAVLAMVVGAVYGRAINPPFIFDDQVTILGNSSIVSLWPPFGSAEHPGPLRPPVPLPTAGRPLVNLSFALNYGIGGAAPIGYHIVNLLIHLGSAILLWAIVRRTLQLPYFANRFETTASWLGLAVSLIWALHPLQTEAVIYTTQRTELMMALFYLATLYCSLRYWHTDESRVTWLALAVLACLCGMASKEVMVSAPVMVLLFDRTFIAGSVMKALRKSWPLYAGLASTWLLLLLLNINAPRGDSAGLQGGPSLISWWLTQSQVLLMYLKLVVWPWPLLIHYQLPYLATFGEAWIYAVPVLLMGIATLVLLWRNLPVGYLGTWVFAILAPTSIIPIVTEVAAERRMYLPLAGLVVLFVVGTSMLAQSLLRRSVDDLGTPRLLPVLVTLPVVLVLGLVSVNRVGVYNDPIYLWRDVVQHQPNNFVAHGNLGSLLIVDPAREAEAIDELQTALALKPEYPAALANLGIALTNTGRSSEAIELLHKALALQPDYSVALNNLGIALTHAGRLPEAASLLQSTLEREPDNFDALNNLGLALTEMGQSADAIQHLEHAVRVEPENANARNNLGRALTNAGRLPEAITVLQAARALAPDDPVLLNNLGFALTQTGRAQEALGNLEHALQVKPDYALAHNNLAIALFSSGQVPRAIEQFRLAVKFNPKDANVHANLANLVAQTGDVNEAIEHYKAAVEIQPDRAEFQKIFADLLRQSGQTQPAIEHYKIALRLQPDVVPVYFNLAQSLAAVDRSSEAVATAKKGIEVARAAKQEAAAEQIEEWLKHYQTELQRSADVPASSPPAIAPEPKPKK